MIFKSYSIRILVLLFAGVLFVGCSSDDDNQDDPTDDTTGGTDDDGGSTDDDLEVARQASLDVLNGGDTITWKIATAFLETASGNLELTGNFNIEDDEFIFSGTNLEWRPANDVRTDATTADETLRDYYRSPIETSITFEPESSSELTALDGRISFSIADDGSLSAVIRPLPKGDGDLLLTLTQKTEADYAAPPAAGLNFTFDVTLLAPGYMGDGNGGLIGSYSENSLFLVHRDDTQSDGTSNPERILKYNFTDGTQTENLFFQSDFVTKRLNIIDDQLIAFGGQFANTYDIALGADPVSSFNHGLVLTRFGLAVQDDNAFIVGTDFTATANSNVTRYNYLTDALEVLGTLPAARFHAGTELINNKLYVFGGRDDFSGEIAFTESFIYDVDTGGTSTFDLPEPAFNTYAARVENLIYVAYETRVEAGEPGTFDDDRNINFGVYDTLDGSFTVLADNLEDSDERSTIHAITIFNGKLYVVYGNPITDENDVQIYSAPIE
ncbi:hypothetical protein [Gilvibacter sediminis]|uniref:hypothetical protein n=1 Tax=Gilvibacter sediminis TaxID=379071 RepID=UPI00235058F0|nr:hypothetical protein [Gilvibacter sediminis]MDC7998802.1 hypothetical protein [Gilvibacter sediminis]